MAFVTMIPVASLSTVTAESVGVSEMASIALLSEGCTIVQTVHRLCSHTCRINNQLHNANGHQGRLKPRDQLHRYHCSTFRTNCCAFLTVSFTAIRRLLLPLVQHVCVYCLLYSNYLEWDVFFIWTRMHVVMYTVPYSYGVGVVAEWLGRLLIPSDHSLINPLIRGRPGSIPALTLELRKKKNHTQTSDRIFA